MSWVSAAQFPTHTAAVYRRAPPLPGTSSGPRLSPRTHTAFQTSSIQCSATPSPHHSPSSSSPPPFGWMPLPTTADSAPTAGSRQTPTRNGSKHRPGGSTTQEPGVGKCVGGCIERFLPRPCRPAVGQWSVDPVGSRQNTAKYKQAVGI